MGTLADRVLKKYKLLSAPVKASAWYVVCNVLNKGIALLSMPIFTRLLTEEEYGTFSVFQSWCSIMSIFTSLNIFQSGYQKGLLLYKDDRDGFTSSQLSLTTIITAVFFMLYVINIDFWTKIFNLSPAIITAMFLELMFMPALEFWAAEKRFDYKYRKYVIITLLMSLISLSGGVLAVISTECKVEARIFSDVFVKILFASVLFFVIILKGKTFFNKRYWEYALRFNLPLIPHYLSNYVLGQSDRLMISRMIGNTQAAFYSVAYTISTMMLLIMTAINNSLTPYIYRAIDSGNTKRIKMVTSPLVVLVGGLCIITMAFAPEVILLFAGRDYMDAVYVIPPVASSVYFVFLYSLFSTIEFFYQRTGVIAVATCISAALNLLLNYIFINKFGYYAAGYTTLFCYIFLALMHSIFHRRVWKQENGELKDLYDKKVIVAASAILLAVMLVMTVTYQLSAVRYGIIAILFVTAFLEKKKLFQIFREFRKGE